MAATAVRTPWSALRAAADKRVRAALSGAVLLAALASALAALAPVPLKQLIDGLAAAAHPASIVTSGAVYLAAVAMARALGAMQVYAASSGDQALQHRLSLLIFQRMLQLPLPDILEETPGGLIAVRQHALQGARSLVALACQTLLPVAVQLCVILIVVATLFDASIWLIVTGAVIAYACVFAWGARRALSSVRQALEADIDAGRLMSEGLIHAETLKSLVAEDALLARYRERLMAAEAHWRTSRLRRLEVGGAVTVVFVLTMTASLWAGGAAAISGEMSVGGFVLLHAYLLQIVSPLETTGFALRDLGQGAAYLRRWGALLRRPGEKVADPEREPLRPDPATRTPPAIVFDSVGLILGGRRLLADVSFTVRPGSLVALVGPSGAGKTSVLRLLQRHHTPSGGRILLDGVCLETLNPQAVRQRSALVACDAALLDGTVLENLMLARPDATAAALSGAIQSAGLQDLAARLPLALATRVGDRGANLSSGERQRIAIGRAVLRDADLLLMDEPTSGLDAITETQIVASIVAAARGRTAIIATHRLLLAAGADEVIVLGEGRVVERGSHDQLLLANGAYSRLWRSQMQSGSVGVAKS